MKLMISAFVLLAAIFGALWFLQDQSFDRGYKQGRLARETELAGDIFSSVARTGQLKLQDSTGTETILQIVTPSPVPTPSE